VPSGASTVGTKWVARSTAPSRIGMPTLR
jgi:hypothetical protein